MRWWVGALVSVSVAARSAPPELTPNPANPPAPKTSGSVIEYQESAGKGVLYQEESGRLVSPLPSAPPGREPLPPFGTKLPAVSGIKKPESVAKKPAGAPPVAAVKPAGAPPVATVKPSKSPVAAGPRPAAPAPAPVAKAPGTLWGERVDKATEAGDNAALLLLAADPAAKPECDRPDRSWSIARAFDDKGDARGAARMLDPLLTLCKDAVVRATTLEIARELVEPETLRRWVAREAPAERTGEAQQRYDRLAIGLALARSTASKAPAAERARTLEAEVGEAIIRFRDADGASGLGWLWLEARDPATAALWFGRAQTWVPGDENVVKGLAYAALQERRFDDAVKAAGALPDSQEKRNILRDAGVGKAENAYHMDRFAETIDLLAAAAQSGPLPRHARELEAWSYSRLGRKADAARRFAALYREGPDNSSAEGLLAAYDNKSMIDADISGSEPMASMLRADRAVAAFNAGRFIEAASLSAQKYGAVGGVTAPQAGVYGAWRKKSGEDGTSRLHEHTTVAAGVSAVVAEGVALKLRLDRHELDAGRPGEFSLIGSAPPTFAPGTQFEPTRATIDEGRLIARIERGLAVNAYVGAASAEAGLAQRAIGGIEVEGAPSWGYFATGLTREPVRETVLSYAGMRDPYGAASWGRVSRDALAGRVMVLNSPWSMTGNFRFARLEGVEVQSNRQRNVEVSGGYDLGLQGFAYTAASISASSDVYDRNLGNFTLGHGGYFSPQRYSRLGAAFDFMTAENREWIARGRISAGLVSKRVDAAPYLPLAPDGRMYPATPTDRATDVSANITAVRRLSAHLQIAAGFSRSVSPQYAESQAFVQLTVLFEPRASVVSADLPTFIR